MKVPLAPSILPIVIVDAPALSRDVLRAVIEAEEAYSVVGAASDGTEALTLIADRRPHVLLLDLSMPRRAAGLDALRQLRDTGVPVAVLADALSGLEVENAVTLGVRGVLRKDVAPSVLYECLRAVAEGAFWIGNERVPDMLDALHRV